MRRGDLPVDDVRGEHPTIEKIIIQEKIEVAEVIAVVHVGGRSLGFGASLPYQPRGASCVE